MPHHRIEKRLQPAGQFKPRELAEQVKKSVLHDIEGEIAIAGEPQREVDDPIAMAAIERLKGRRVAVICGGNEFGVSHRMVILWQQRARRTYIAAILTIHCPHAHASTDTV
jgi:hypothetical protein